MAYHEDYTDEELAIFKDQGMDITNEPLTEDEPAAHALPVEGLAAADPEADAAALATPAADPEADAAALALAEGTTAADPAADPAATSDNRMVPHAALHAERTKAAAATAQAADLSRQLASATARISAIMAARAAPAEPEPLPNIEENPQGFVEALAERVAGITRQTAINEEERTIDTQLELDEKNYTTFTPDYPQASAHWVQSRARELLFTNGGDKQAAMTAMTKEVRAVARLAWDRGIPASQAMYELAQARGYVKAADPAPVVAAKPAGPAAAAVVAAARTGAEHSRPMGSAGGSGDATQLNGEAVLNMSDEEFERHMKLGQRGADARFAALMGG